MIAKKVRKLAQEWAESCGEGHQGFVGAHLLGGLLELDPDEEFAIHRDVDICVVLHGQDDPLELREELFRGILVDGALVSSDLYRSPQHILVHSTLAPSLARDSILVDPQGSLHAIQSVVSSEFARRRWVRERCRRRRELMRTALDSLAGAKEATPAAQALWQFVQEANACLALAYLKAPSGRRCLVLLGELLTATGRGDLQERILNLMGFADLSVQQVEAHLLTCMALFEKARAYQTEAANANPALRFRPRAGRYIADGAREMIDLGWHREAMYWIGGNCCLSALSLQGHAPPEVLSWSRPLVQGLLDSLGLLQPSSWRIRATLAERVCREIEAQVEQVLTSHPAITD